MGVARRKINAVIFFEEFQKFPTTRRTIDESHHAQEFFKEAVEKMAPMID